MPSPYEESLGPVLGDLHPRLRAYFGEIPRGSVGVGVGSFDVVGTPRRWLRPVLRMLARDGILFPVWDRDVPFTVINRSAVDSRGNTTVVARRTFHFPGGDTTMSDAITAERGRLVDHLGTSRRLIAGLSGRVVDGALLLRSTTVAVRVGRTRIRIPTGIAPVVTLEERFDEASDRQRVTVVVAAPLVGRLYEYSGSFIYRIESTP